MKALTSMDNVDKGKLLAALFPDKLGDILDSLTGTYNYLTENEDSLRATWSNGMFPFNFWYRVAGDVATTVDRYGARLTKSSSLFADQLFDHYNALYTIECIVKQAELLPELPGNQAYKLGVRLLFDHYIVAP